MERRHFLKLSAGTVAAVMYTRLTYAIAPGQAAMKQPDEVWAEVDNQWVKLTGNNGTYTYKEIRVQVKPGASQQVYIQSPRADLQSVKLVWKYNTKVYSKILGDHWERSYADLYWQAAQADKHNPWYVLLHDGNQTAAFGVKTGANTLCFWQVKPETIELTLDTRSGGVGVKLGDRKLHAADIVTTMSRTGENAFATDTRFCRIMCDKPLLPKQPVYGINDWYVVYGKNSFDTVKEHTSVMAAFVSDTNNKPFSVIDDGWQQPDDFSIVNDKFKDMHKMADEVKSLGMRPGLWTRPLIARQDDKLSLLAPKLPGRPNTDERILDPTIPENLERVRRNISLYNRWGYHMVKHDYSSYDIFGRWGSQMKTEFTNPGWKFADQTKTNAEIINQLYRTITKAKGDMYIIGCNTVSHLSAGMFELNRIGDDTSGREWKRTRDYGVNTMGFRMPQNNTFYAADGDCIGLTKDVPWEKNKQWLQLVAESGSPLFISAQTNILGADQKAAIKLAFAQAAKVQPTGEPLDWLETKLPERWKLNGRDVKFDWA